jgi:transcriptional regulator with XRE-family HTH domain
MVTKKLGKMVKAEAMPNLNSLFSASVLGQAIKAKRTSRGWKQLELATRATLSKKTIIKIEKGDSSVTFSHILKVMDVVGLSFKIFDHSEWAVKAESISNKMHTDEKPKDDGWYE